MYYQFICHQVVYKLLHFLAKKNTLIHWVAYFNCAKLLAPYTSEASNWLKGSHWYMGIPLLQPSKDQGDDRNSSAGVAYFVLLSHFLYVLHFFLHFEKPLYFKCFLYR